MHLIDLDIFTAIIQIRTAKSQETSQALEKLELICY